MQIEVRIVESLEDLAVALALRKQVFVEGQGVPFDVERDKADDTAIHAVGFVNGSMAGTGRLVFHSVSEAQIGRMAVTEPFRRQGLGGLILACLERQVVIKGVKRVFLHAQVHAQEFYERHGYTSQGAEFTEAGITHIAMFKHLE